MVRVIFALLVGALSIAPVAGSAQTSSGDPFCALSSLDMLAALDGNWTLQQGPGIAVAVTMTIPLPPSAAQSFSIDYDPARRVAILSGGSPRQSMVLLPTAPDDVLAALWLMSEAEADDLLQIGTGCDFYSLPLMLGFNTYALTGPAANNYAVVYADPWGEESWVCFSPNELFDELFDSLEPDPGYAYWFVRTGGAEDEDGTFYVAEDTRGACEIPNPEPGTMVMSLAIKFQSSTFGTGMLHFRGQQSGYPFFAKAPVTLSR